MLGVQRDNSIKLFGKTISSFHYTSSSSSSSVSPVVGEFAGDIKNPTGEIIVEKGEDGKSHYNPLISNENQEPATPSGTNDNPKTPSNDKETSLQQTSKNEDQSDTSISEDKTLKKPDKILPCPRCDSMNTKFCYYNNYNVNQPRHFCKNCMRYWTAGGTMRNVPVGAGRRKNKNSYRNMVPEALQIAHIDSPNGLNHQHMNNNCTVLSFGNENRRESVDYRSKLHSKSEENEGKNGILTEPVIQNFNGFPCPYPWNSGFPIPIYPPPPYWGCWVSPPCTPSILGKHTRDWEAHTPSKTEKHERKQSCDGGVLMPKTLRIDDSSEAAMASIWATLGIESEKKDFMSRASLFKSFQKKGDEKNHVDQSSALMQANPAALSRSLHFHEST